jgi:preprotein translocase subunit SecA
VIYGLRTDVLDKADVRARIEEMLTSTIDGRLDNSIPEGLRREEWDLDTLKGEMETLLLTPFDIGFVEKTTTREEIRDRCLDAAKQAYANKEAVFGEQMRDVERRILLAVIDEKWRDHLHEIDIVKEGIHLRAYAQKDPLLEYKGEAFRAFDEVMAATETDTVRFLYRVVPMPPAAAERPASAAVGGMPQRRPVHEEQEAVHANVSAFQEGPRAPSRPPPPGRARQRQIVRTEPKIGRNDPCPCGSGKKYKKCCGANR